jgi:thymidylate kinase
MDILPDENIIVINASRPKAAVFEDVKKELDRLLF